MYATSKGNGNGNSCVSSAEDNEDGGQVAVAPDKSKPVQILAKGGGGGGKSGGSSGGSHGNSGNDHGNGNNGKGGGSCGGSTGIDNALERGQGKKLGLYKKLQNQWAGQLQPGQLQPGNIEHILAVIDNIVNGEVNLPPGEHESLFKLVREVGAGYTIVGTTWTYNSKNEIATRSNLIRLEDYAYTYDQDGNLLSDGRSKYEWNSQGRLAKVTFPDGFGEAYAYDSLGRLKSKTQFNHRGETQEVTNYHYKGDSWMVVKQTDESGKETLSFGFNEGGKPLSVTYQGQTFWYVYNGHGDVVALTDQDGNVAARYEYDAWGLVTRMFNRFGERVREGIGYIGDLGSGNGSPGSLQGPVDENGNIVPDYTPDNNSDPQNGSGGTLTGSTLDGTLSDNTLTTSTATLTDTTTSTSAAGDTIVGVEQEPTEDITTELVKLNPYRYAGYYWDRKTQYYYLQARYYDPRNGRFLSADTYRGEIQNPLSLHLYAYAFNNPVNYVDPTGHMAWSQVDDLALGVWDSAAGTIKSIFSWSTYVGLWDRGKAVYNGDLSLTELGKSLGTAAWEPIQYLINNTGYVFGDDPSDSEVREYGKKLGEVLQMAAGSTAAIKTIAKSVPKLAAVLFKSLTQKIAKDVGKALGGVVSKTSGSGWKVEIPNGKRPILVRVMDAGSGGREKPYFRISIDGKGSLTAEGKLSNDPVLTHINIENASDTVNQILNIIKLYRGD